MAYKRQKVINGKTRLNKELYDNLQDGIDELKESLRTLNYSSVDDALNEKSENPVQNKAVTKAFKQLPVVQVPYFKKEETGVNGLYLRVDIEELEPLVIYGNGEEFNGKSVHCYMVIRCDDGTEKAVTSFSRNNLFYIQRAINNSNLITLYTVEGNNRYSIDITDKSNKSKVKSEILWNQKYLPINNMREYIPTRDYEPATKKYVDDVFNSVSITVDDVLDALPTWQGGAY